MLEASTLVFAAALLLGVTLAVLYLRGGDKPPYALAALHGLVAVAAFALLLVALQGPPRGEATGSQSFGLIAVVAFALAAAVGLTFLVSRLRRKRLSGTLVGLHGALAVTGFVMLLVYTLLG